MQKLEENRKSIARSKPLKLWRNAHVLWGFKVGAAVLAEDGKIYEGCNVESWISGLGTSAPKDAPSTTPFLHGNRRRLGK
jgi:cytidine deaminase